MSSAAAAVGPPEAPGGGVVAFSGHRLRLDADAETAMRRDMDAVLGRHAAEVGYGSLACGADVLWAEALLERGAAVHVVLPFDPEEFVETSVRPGGDGWVARHVAVREAAASMTVVWNGSYRGRDELYGLATDRFLGRARLRADEAAVTPCFGVVWDRTGSSGVGGTGTDVARWRRAGGAIDVVEPRGTRVRGGRRPREGPALVVGAVLFAEADELALTRGDVPADDAAQARRAIEATIDAASDTIRYRNVGDDVLVVGRSVAAVGTLALELRAAIEPVTADGGRALGLGLVAHAGVTSASDDTSHDTADDRIGAWARELHRSEPCAPVEGEVYATETFAAGLALDPHAEVVAERVVLAPNSNDRAGPSIYRLRRRRHGRGDVSRDRSS